MGIQFINSAIQFDIYFIKMDKKRSKRVKKLILKNYVEDNHQLYLPSAELEGEDMEQIVKVDLPALETLKISDNCIGLEGAKFLSTGRWSHLRRLELKCSKLGPKAVLHLIKADWKQMEHVRLGFNQLGNQGLRYLCQADWKQLTDLWLQGNHIGEEGSKYLAKSNWPKLHFLSLWDNRFSIECAKNLTKLDSPLKTLDITFCEGSQRQTPRIYRILRNRFGLIEIRT